VGLTRGLDQCARPERSNSCGISEGKTRNILVAPDLASLRVRMPSSPMDGKGSGMSAVAGTVVHLAIRLYLGECYKVLKLGASIHRKRHTIHNVTAAESLSCRSLQCASYCAACRRFCLDQL
jgi:hypothetical protein